MYQIIQILFIILKLTNLIDWSWITVFVPTWILLGLVILAWIQEIIEKWIDNYDYFK